MKLHTGDYDILYRIPFNIQKSQFIAVYPPVLSSFINESEFITMITTVNTCLKKSQWLWPLIIYTVINAILSGILYWKQFIPLWAFTVNNISSLLGLIAYCKSRSTQYCISNINHYIDKFNKQNFKNTCISLVGTFSNDLECQTYLVVWIHKSSIISH